VDDEYKGRNERADGTPYPADVHYNPGGMSCFKCHTEEEMHGTEGGGAPCGQAKRTVV